MVRIWMPAQKQQRTSWKASFFIINWKTACQVWIQFIEGFANSVMNYINYIKVLIIYNDL